MKKILGLFVILLSFCSCHQKDLEQTSNSSPSHPVVISDWPNHVLDVIHECCNGFSIPFFAVNDNGYYEASVETTGGGSFAVIYCYNFDENEAIESYSNILINNAYEVEDWTIDLGCYVAQKNLSTSTTSIIQYNVVKNAFETYFMIATAVSGTTQSGNESTVWPTKDVISILGEDIPHFEATKYIYSPYVTGDGSYSIIIECYGKDVNQQSEIIYKEQLISEEYVITESSGTFFGQKGNINIMFYY